MSDSGDWWLRAPELVAEISRRSSGPVRSACYRFGDVLLEIDSNYSSVLDDLRLWYGECAVEGSRPTDGVLTRWSVRSIEDPPVALVSFHKPEPRDSEAVALSVFNHLHRREHSEVQSPVPGWRLIYDSASSARPFMASRGTDSLIDLLQEPPGFLVNYIVSAMLCLQRKSLFVHAASVGIHGMGVLLMGYGGAGKTTTSLALASRGHAFLGDNMACIRTRSREILPFRRSAAIKPGPRARTLDELLRDNTHETVRLPDGRTRILIQVGDFFPASKAGAVKLGGAFYLRRFAERPALEAFTPAPKEQEFLNRLSRDPMAVFGVSSAHRLMNLLVLVEMLSKVRCYFLDVGSPEDTADLIEKTMEVAWV